jgi:hypothetical protein
LGSYRLTVEEILTWSEGCVDRAVLERLASEVIPVLRK